MIREMISKLMQEATAETEHHGWCQAELGENKITRDTKSAAIDDLSATLEQLNAEIAKLTEEVADLSADVAELSKDRAEATDVREAEHAKNTATVADSMAAQDAVTNALAILSDFYAKAGQATAMVQGVDNNLP
jgi:chromosome segregation ATPase